MRIPEPRQLPSGRWIAQVQIDKQRKSATFDTAEQARQWALEVKDGIARTRVMPQKLTVGEAIDLYIESKDSVLSPETVAGYKRIRKNALQDLMNVRLGDLTQERIQRSVNAMAKQRSPKTVSNAHGLLTAALAQYLPDMAVRTTLPQKRKTEIIMPTESDVTAIANAVRGKKVELPTLLAMCMGLRMSEILGLTWDCVDGDYLHINQARVDHGIKTTKAYHSTRTLEMPPYIRQLFDAKPRSDGLIFNVTRGSIYQAFQKYTQRAGIQHYRFHDLRHVYASISMEEKVPDAYIVKNLGHATDHMLKQRYGHTISEAEQRYNTAVIEKFSALIGQNSNDNANAK